MDSLRHNRDRRLLVVREGSTSDIRRNADKISAAITKAAAAKAEADRQLKEAATKLTRLEQEIAEFRAQAQKDAAAELERLRDMMKLDIEKVGVAAKSEIAAAERAARVELKALAAKLAVDGAESLVAKQMTPAVQESMINSFVQTSAGEAELKSASLQYATALADIVLEQGAAEPARNSCRIFTPRIRIGGASEFPDQPRDLARRQTRRNREARRAARRQQNHPEFFVCDGG